MSFNCGVVNNKTGLRSELFDALEKIFSSNREKAKRIYNEINSPIIKSWLGANYLKDLNGEALLSYEIDKGNVNVFIQNGTGDRKNIYRTNKSFEIDVIKKMYEIDSTVFYGDRKRNVIKEHKARLNIKSSLNNQNKNIYKPSVVRKKLLRAYSHMLPEDLLNLLKNSNFNVVDDNNSGVIFMDTIASKQDSRIYGANLDKVSVLNLNTHPIRLVKTFLHEQSHMALKTVINNYLDPETKEILKKDFDPKIVKSLAAIEHVYEKILRDFELEYDNNFIESFKNLDEFIAAFMSDVKFRDFLKTIAFDGNDVESKSLYQFIKNHIIKILNYITGQPTMFDVVENSLGVLLFNSEYSSTQNTVRSINRNYSLGLQESVTRFFDIYEKGELESDIDDEISFSRTNDTLDKILQEKETISAPKEDDSIDKYSTSFGFAERVTNFINTFRLNPFPTTKDWAIDQANKRWGIVNGNEGQPKSKALYVDHKTILDYDSYVQYLVDTTTVYQAKGKIIHGIIQKFIDPSLAIELGSKVRQLIVETGLSIFDYEWLLENPKNIELILKKLGINAYDEGVEEDNKDIVKAEVEVASKLLSTAGTIDILVNHSDGRFSLHDVKTSKTFNKLSHKILRYGDGTHKSLTESRSSMAKFQLAMYAFILKVENPDIKFRNISIAHVPNEESLLDMLYPMNVEVSAYLEMIEKYYKNEHPDIYKKIKSYAFKKEDYSDKYSPKLQREIEDDEEMTTSIKIQTKLFELKKLIQSHNNPNTKETPEGLKSFQEKDTRAKILSKEITELLAEKEMDISLWSDPNSEIGQDISLASSWLSSAASSKSPFIQVFEHMRNKRKKSFMDTFDKKDKIFKSMLRSIYEDRLRKESKFGNLAVPLSKTAVGSALINLVDNINPRDMFDFAFRVVDDEGSPRLVFNYSDKDFQDREKELKRSITKLEKQLVRYMVDEFERFFVDSKSENINLDGKKQALANQIATTRILGDKVTHRKVSNLELFNGKTKEGKILMGHSKVRSMPFEYNKKTFIPLIPKSLREIAADNGIFSPAMKDEYHKRYMTWYYEREYESWGAEDEALPMKYLPNGKKEFVGEYVDGKGWVQSEFSLDLENIWDRFMRSYIYKQEMDDVYSYGKGLKEWLRTKKMKDNPMFKNTADFLETHIEQVVRKRKDTDFDLFRRGNKSDTTAKFNWHKIIKTAKQVTVAPIMWLKPITGTANGIFTFLYTTKEAIKGSILDSGYIKGVDGSIVDFTLKDLIWGMKEWWKMTKDTMFGQHHSNKLWILLNKTGYLPDNYDWATNSSDQVTNKNALISSSSFLFFHTMPEEALAAMIFAAQMRRMKVNVRDNKNGTVTDTGNKNDFTSLWDMYDVVRKEENGVQYYDVDWKKDSNTGKSFVRGYENLSKDSSKQDLEEISDLDSREITKLKRVYERLHGSYRRDERVRLEYYVLGEAFLQYKKYLPNILKNAMGSKGLETSLGNFREIELPESDRQNKKKVMEWVSRMSEGRWRVVLKSWMSYLNIKSSTETPKNSFERFKHKILPKASESYKFDLLSDGQKAELVDFYVTISLWATFELAGSFLLGGAGDDDSFRKWIDRIQNDFSQQYNMLEVAKNLLNNPAPASWRKIFKTADALAEASWSGAWYLGGYEDYATTQEGVLKGWSELRRSIPFVASWYDYTRWWENTDVLVRLR